MSLSLTQICLKEKKTKTESEYENSAFDDNVANVIFEQEDYYEELKPSSDVRNLEVRQTAKPNEYSKWESDNTILYANQDAINQTSNKEDNGVKLPISVPQKQSTNYFWKIVAVICAFLFLGTGSAFVVVTISLQSNSPGSSCEGIECLNNGTCVISNGEIVCSCLDGFSGSRCEVTPCNQTTCDNMGTCYMDRLKPNCACRPGFSGHNCSRTPCDRDPCFNGAYCNYHVDIPDPICECKHGYSGRLCEATPCTSSPCANYGVCTINGGTYNCKCPNGYSGPRCADMKCSTELPDEACMFDQDIYDSGDWLKRYGTTSYFYPSSYSSVRFITKRNIALDDKKCLSFNHFVYTTNSNFYGQLSIYENLSLKHTIIPQYNDARWKYETFKLSNNQTNKPKIVIQAGRKYSSTYIYINNITIHRCQNHQNIKL